MNPGAAPARRRTLYFARHGETAWNLVGRWQGHTDVALSDRGREQAVALGERLRAHTIGEIRSSDLSRAFETATIVARALGLPGVVADPSLRERCFGVFEGLTREECATRFPEIWAQYEQDRAVLPPGAELHADVVARMRTAVARAAVSNDDGTSPDPGALLVVGHGASLRLLLSAETGRAFTPITNGGLLRAVLSSDGRLEDVEDLGAS